MKPSDIFLLTTGIFGFSVLLHVWMIVRVDKGQCSHVSSIRAPVGMSMTLSIVCTILSVAALYRERENEARRSQYAHLANEHISSDDYQDNENAKDTDALV